MNTETDRLTDYSAALYIRLSKEDDNEGESESVANQRSLLTEFAEKNGFCIYAEYIDDGFSGGGYDRPAFNRLLADIEGKKVNLVITKDLSRLGRDYIQTGHYIERFFPEKRVRYISILDGIDTGTDSSINDMTPLRAVMNDMYAKDISKKIRSVKRDKQRKGLFIGGKAPYGYKLSEERKNTFVIDEQAAETVRFIYREALSGKSCREIAIGLNERKIPPPAVYAGLTVSGKGPYSGLWSAERVSYTLKNQMYIGNMVQGRTRKLSYKLKKCVSMPSGEWVIVENTHPAIIERADFNKVQTLLDSRRKTRHRTYDYPLKGMVFCKECGYPLGVINRAKADGGTSLYFICRTYQRFTKAGACDSHCIRVETVAQAVAERIEAVCEKYAKSAGLPKIAESAVKEMRANGSLEAEIACLTAQMSKTTDSIDKLYSDRLNGIIDNDDFTRLYAALKREERSLAERKCAVRADAAKNKTMEISAKELVERFIASAGENRELLCGLLERIELTKNKELLLHFSFCLQ